MIAEFKQFYRNRGHNFYSLSNDIVQWNRNRKQIWVEQYDQSLLYSQKGLFSRLLSRRPHNLCGHTLLFLQVFNLIALCSSFFFFFLTNEYKSPWFIQGTVSFWVQEALLFWLFWNLWYFVSPCMSKTEIYNYFQCNIGEWSLSIA